MAKTTQDVELRIRATNYSRQTTTQVVDALNNMTRAQDAQIESAKKGETTVSQLEQTYVRLEAAAKALIGHNSLIKLFQSQSQTVDELKAKLEAARKAQQDFAAAASKSAAPKGMSYNEFKSQNLAEFTKAEGSHAAAMARISKEWKDYKAQLQAANPAMAQSAEDARKLASAVSSAEKELARAEGRLSSTQNRLGEFGISAANAAQAQQQIIAAVNNANVALERQEAAINTHDTHAAARKAQADAIAQREAQIKVDNLFAQAERDVQRALEAERQAQIAANQAAADKQRERQVEVDVTFTQAQRDAAEALNKKTAALRAQQVALRAAADQAERMTRSANNIARGSAPVSTPNLAGQIRDIQNPNDAAVRTVAGLETAIAGLEKRVREINGPVKDYRGAVDEATRAQKALLQVAGQVDAYQRQIAAVRAARAEFVTARTDVAKLIAEMRSGNAGDDVTTRLSRAQGTMQAAAQRLGGITTTARQMRSELQAAGVDTSNLSSAEQALVAQANRATAALNSLSQAYQRNGAAAENAGSRVWNWFGGNGGRTTLSYMQRMRGELLSLAAGFIGLNAAIETGRKSLEAYSINQAIMSRLSIANGGDARKAAEDFAYLQAQADRIGFVFAKIAPAYTKFAIAASSAGFTTQQTRFSFEQIAGAAVKARLSTEELEGVMKAFEQMMSKGTIQAEELRGQLGDRLPGAFQIAARAANMTVEEYTKAISLGQIGSDQVVAIARELGKTYGAAQTGAETLLVAQARFENAANRFLTNTAAGGYVESFQKLLNKLTEMMNNGQADKLAAHLSAGFSAVIDVLGFVADNIDAIKLAVEALIGLKLIQWLMKLPALFMAVKTELVLVNAQMAVFQGWLARQQAAAALSTALGAGGLTGVIARLTPALIACGNALIFLSRAVPFVGAALAAYQATRFAIDSIDDRARNRVAAQIDATTQALKNSDKAQREYEKAKGTENEERFKAQAERFKALAVKAVKDQQAAIREAQKGGIVWDDLMQGKVAAAAQRQSRALSGADQPRDNAAATPDPGAGDNSRQMLASLTKKLQSEDQKNQRQYMLARLKAEKGDLAERLAIVREPFDELKKQYADSIKDADARGKAIAMIEASYAKAAQVERQKYANEQAKSGESAAKKRAALVEQIRMRMDEAEKDAINRSAKQDTDKPFEERMKARVDAVAKAYDKLGEDIAKLRPLDPKGAAAFDKQLASIKEQRKAIEEVNAKRDEANRLVDEFNKKQGELAALIDAVKAKEESGILDPQTAMNEINALVATLGPGIEEAGNKALEFATNMHEALDPTRFAEIFATVSRGLAKNNVDATIVANQAIEAQRQMNELLAQQQREIDAITLKRQLGMIDANQEAAQVNAVMAKYAQGLQFSAQQLQNFVEIARQSGGFTKQQSDEMEASAQRVMLTAQAGIVKATELEATIVGSVAQGGTNMFDQWAQSIAKVVSGQQGIGEGFRGMMAASAQFFAGLLKDIAMAILRLQILKALQSMGGGVGSAATTMLNGHHSGGIAGGQASFTRSVPVTSMLGAIRYHTGGIAGFAPNEVPAVLKRGEEVLTRNDPRHILNLGSQMANSNSAPQSQRFVLVDDRSKVAEAMATAEGEKVTLVHLRNNLPTLKQWFRK